MVHLLNRLFIYVGLFTVILIATYIAADPYPSTMSETRFRLTFLFLGLALNQFGLYNLTHKIFTKRKYMQLRDETDNLIYLVRDLNTHAIENKTEEMDRVVERMHAQVEKLKEVAGVEDAPQPSYEQEPVTSA